MVAMKFLTVGVAALFLVLEGAIVGLRLDTGKRPTRQDPLYVEVPAPVVHQGEVLEPVPTPEPAEQDDEADKATGQDDDDLTVVVPQRARPRRPTTMTMSSTTGTTPTDDEEDDDGGDD